MSFIARGMRLMAAESPFGDLAETIFSIVFFTHVYIHYQHTFGDHSKTWLGFDVAPLITDEMVAADKAARASGHALPALTSEQKIAKLESEIANLKQAMSDNHIRVILK
mmetsp:Transcript_45358/g.84704  ORF Transcript_45358/g.84704 Transcript_45358/m.84704 type:complete len:109 (-) Transcript_45358:337-663(-)|eukprot:CAMPEP_0114257082 /NCGR_PEP_ID=MMETSP0058-20121206/18526_1 /TAXON_ID=36894 /ORGANISM="Pyramimonas parkeae, CCMP726" /LENGTH=108 /DNA_ID=CAMNT_0001371751 /DNA_START=47 /DNA_END=373 /DNA_ORIENTATION=+